MTPNVKTQLMVCFVFVACNTSVAQAGFFEDLISAFSPPAAPQKPAAVPAAPKPAVKPAPQTEHVVIINQAPQAAPKPVQPTQSQLPQHASQNQPTVNAETKLPSKPSQKELNELLWLAALQGNDGRIRGLVEQGANPASGTKHGETPLHVAASRGHLKPIIYLANHGGSVNARTRNGWTPLHHAARFGHFQAVKYLLHMGAIPHIRTADKGRKSPMEMAVDNGYIEIAELFGYRSK